MATLDIPELLSRDEAARFLRVKKSLLDNWASTGRNQLPFIRVGRLARYRREDLEAFLAANTQTSTAAFAAAR